LLWPISSSSEPVGYMHEGRTAAQPLVMTQRPKAEQAQNALAIVDLGGYSISAP
jgi:hypothetical protein